MEIKNVAVTELRHAEYNPRSLSEMNFDQLKSSLQRFGFVEPIIVNSAGERRGVIVGGNQRFEVAKALGMQAVPVFFVDIPDLKSEKELNIRLNKNGGEWDFDKLANEFSAPDLIDWGFQDWELDIGEASQEMDEDKAEGDGSSKDIVVEVTIPAGQYEAFLEGLKRLKITFGLPTDSEAILKIVSCYGETRSRATDTENAQSNEGDRA